MGESRAGVDELELDEAIVGRRTVRRYRQDPVPKRLLAQLVEAAIQAPSSFNLQPWRFYIVGGKLRGDVVTTIGMCTIHLQDALASMGKQHRREAEEFFVDLGGAPNVILIAVPPSDNWLDHVNYLLAAGCALQNIQLKAHELGLGTCCCTAAVWVKEQLCDVLGLKDQEIVTALLVGYPDQMPPAPPRDHEVVEWLDS